MLEIIIGGAIIMIALGAGTWLIIEKVRESKIVTMNVWLDRTEEPWTDERTGETYTYVHFTIDELPRHAKMKGVWTLDTQGIRVRFIRRQNHSLEIVKIEPRRMIRPEH